MMKRIGNFVLKIIEIYIPTVSFIIIFFSFNAQVIYRYFLNSPLSWTHEVILINFVWITLLGACYARHHSQHIKFSMIFDLVSPKMKIIFTLISNGLIIVIFSYIFIPIIDYINFMASESSPFLNIPFSIIDFPFIIFLVLFIYYSAHDFIINIKKLISNSNLNIN